VLIAAIPAAAAYGLMALGVLVAGAGHVVHAPRIVAVGLVALFAGTGLMFLGAHQAYEAHGPIGPGLG
jgi:hypothetical protein